MQFWGAKGMLEAIAGPAEKEKTLAKLRTKGFKIPRGGEREPDGTFLVIDADADDGAPRRRGKEALMGT
jgi:hypothetical protein